MMLTPGCGSEQQPDHSMAAAPQAMDTSVKPATAATVAAQRAARIELNFSDDADFERAQRGFIARDETLQVTSKDGRIIWDQGSYDFVAGDAPNTVNPGLWRQSRLNGITGLFKVRDGIYQVRGYDLSNISFVESDNGWIVIDPLTSVETAAKAIALVNRELGERPIKAVIYTHSHADHFGGVKAMVGEADVKAGKVRIVAPEGFMHHTVSENIVAGNAMMRRASYMFGNQLAHGPQGHVDSGLGRKVAFGTSSLIAPTDTISKTGTRLTLDGIEVVFQNTPGAEAPAEMMFYFPALKALCVSEEANATLHNMYTLRGAQVRSGKLWAQWLDEAIVMFGADLDVVFGSHHWPRWGREDAVNYLEKQRDLYKYIHDQTLRLANQGLMPLEIAEQIELPPVLGKEWFNREFYGTVNHNVKATYQLYLGWFNGNPATLHPLPPEASATRYVEYMGGIGAVLSKAQDAYADGDYRWVVEVLNHVVFADSQHVAARQLQADAMEQLGYQAESGPWRNFYLTGAKELRFGLAEKGLEAGINSDMMTALTPAMVFDLLSVRLNGPRAANEDLSFNLRFTRADETADDYLLMIKHGVLNYRAGKRADADASLELSLRDFLAMLQGSADLQELVKQQRATVDGKLLSLYTFGKLFDEFDNNFPIVTP